MAIYSQSPKGVLVKTSVDPVTKPPWVATVIDPTRSIKVARRFNARLANGPRGTAELQGLT